MLIKNTFIIEYYISSLKLLILMVYINFFNCYWFN